MEFIIEHLSKNFEKKEVLRNIDFTFEEGKIYGLLGRNGAGKTTFFNCINGDIAADSGTFTLRTETGERKVQPEDIGYVLSTPTVPEFLTGREFLKFFLDINEKEIPNPQPLDVYFDYMSIDPEDRDKLMKDYSHGMKNKMQMLVNIIAQPNVLLLDEPLTSLDVVVAEEMKNLLRSLKDGRITIFSTHIIEDISSSCNQVVVINKGELKYFGDPSDMVEMANGKVWQFNIDKTEFEKVLDKSLVIHHIQEGDTIRVRYLSVGQPYEGAVEVEANLEDAYLCLLKNMN